MLRRGLGGGETAGRDGASGVVRIGVEFSGYRRGWSGGWAGGEEAGREGERQSGGRSGAGENGEGVGGGWGSDGMLRCWTKGGGAGEAQLEVERRTTRKPKQRG